MRRLARLCYACVLSWATTFGPAAVAHAEDGGEVDVSEASGGEVADAQTKLGSEAPEPLDLRAPNLDWGVGGKFQLDVIYDINALGLEPDDGFYREFITAQIPIAGPAAEREGRIGFSPNQSRFYGYIGAPTRWGPFRAYVQINLFRNSTSTDIQVHRTFAQWAWLHIAYDYTQFLNLRTIPRTLDYEGPGAIPETRRGLAYLEIPLARLGKSNGFFLAIGAEQTDTQATLPADVVSRDRAPSTIARLIYATDRVDLQVGGLYRRLRFSGGGFDTKTNSWGISFQGVVDFLEGDEAIVGVIYGDALGSYFQDTDGFGLDAAPDGITIRPIRALGLWLGYTHEWLRTLSSTASFSYIHLDNGFDQTPNPVGTYQETYYASANLIWTPWHPMDVGLEYLYGWRRVTENTAVDGERSNRDHRLHLSIIFKFEVSRQGVEKALEPAGFRP